MRTPAIAVIILLCAPFNVFADGLDALVEVGRSQGEIAKTLNQETKNFENVRRALEKGILKNGMPSDAIRKLYGDPVIEFKEGAKVKWVYKAAESSFSDGLKIYLIFDGDGSLEEAKTVDLRKEKKK